MPGSAVPARNGPAGHLPADRLSPVACLPPASLYLHIPFCLAKCSYCDFASYPGLGAWHAPYVQALRTEVRQVGEQWQRPALATVYIGGGTPTVLPTGLLLALLETVGQAFSLSPDAEVTLEANPGTVSPGALDALRRAGVNRLSYGVQSFQPALLALLERIHTPQQAAEAVHLARRAGFANLNLDLIYGLPGQTLPRWQADLEAALALEPEHLSLYALALEPGTPLTQRVSCGEVPSPDSDLAAGMYEWARTRLAAAGYGHYELSNWGRQRPAGPDLRAHHNLICWLNRPYAGCGAAASSWLGGRRLANVRHPEAYVERLCRGQPPIAEEECITPDLERAETMILGLRLLAGVSRPGFQARFGADPAHLYARAIAESEALGLLEMDEAHIRLTARGHLLGNQVFWRFLP